VALISLVFDAADDVETGSVVELAAISEVVVSEPLESEADD